MTKVFVDVDDTLVLFGGNSPHPYGVIEGDPFELNYPLIEKLKEFKGEIVVWSGGGAAYARKVAMMVLPREVEFTAETKGATSVRGIKAGDIVVDDQPEYYTASKERGVHVFRPFEEWDLATTMEKGQK